MKLRPRYALIPVHRRPRQEDCGEFKGYATNLTLKINKHANTDVSRCNRTRGGKKD